jgi:hypothetical protein
VSIAPTFGISSPTVFVLTALTAAQPYDPGREFQAVECTVDVLALDGELRNVWVEAIDGGEAVEIPIGAPYHVSIVNSTDTDHRLQISIVNHDDPQADAGAFIGSAETNPLLIIDHAGQIGDGLTLFGFSEVTVECRQLT